MPVETIFTNLPVVSIYGDGSVVTSGPQIMIYPGPVVPNLLVRKLDAAGMQAVLTAAQEAGVLTEPIDYGQPPVADVPSTVVTVNVNDKSYTQGANALGGDFGTDNLTPGADRRPRQALDVRRLDEQPRDARRRGAHRPRAALRRSRAGVSARPVADQLPTGEPAPTVVPWPVTTLPLASIGECTAATGDVGAQVTDTMTKANQLTYFTDAGRTYQVLARPLLPDETGCPS